MTKKFIEEQTELLEKLKERLKGKKITKPKNQADDADLATETTDFELALENLSSQRNSLREIDNALKKIKEGNYGICELTGEQISIERLQALPHARYSIKAQSELEKNNFRKKHNTEINLFDTEGDEESEEEI